MTILIMDRRRADQVCSFMAECVVKAVVPQSGLKVWFSAVTMRSCTDVNRINVRIELVHFLGFNSLASAVFIIYLDGHPIHWT